MSNQNTANRIGSFRGHILCIGKYRLRSEWKGVVAALVREAEPAGVWTFAERGRVGYVTRVAPNQEEAE
jgi:hypothetical protein